MSHQNRSLHEISNSEPGEPICRECQDYVHGHCSIHSPLLVVPNIKKEDNLQSELPQMQFLVKDEAEGCSSDTAFQNDSASINPIADSSEASEKNPDEELANFLAILEQCTSSLNVTEDVILLDGNGDFELSELVLNSENLAEKESYIKRIRAQLDEEIMRDIEAEAKLFEAIQISNTFRENLCKNQSEELVKNYPHTSTSTQNEETNEISINSKRKCLTTKKSITTKKPKFQNTNEDALETDLESETNIKKNTFVIKKQNFQEPIFKKTVDLNSKRTSKERKTYIVPKKQKIKTRNKYKYMEKGNIKGVQKPIVNTNFTKFQCNECGKEFSTKDTMTDHIPKCTKPKSLVKGSQLEKADTLNSLHLSVMYNCDICTYKTNQKHYIETHLKIHSTTKGLSCDICEYRCANKSTLKDHMRTHTGEKPFTCNICEFRCAQKSNLKAHMRTHTREKPICCNICEFRCSKKSTLKDHIRTHTGEKPFTCNICEFRCAYKSNLKAHIRTHTGEKPFCCNICEFRCSQKSHLKNHRRTHTSEKPFTCNICEFRCSLKSTLKDHIRTHTDEKPFTCNICEFRCSLKSTLKNHIRTHTGEKPFTCNICEFRCSLKSTLKNHIRTHTGEKPFTCNICEFRCSLKSTLKNHIRTHTGEKPFTCNICEFRCSLKSTLKAHIRTHTGEKPFTCNICEFRCSKNSTLKVHMRTHTGEKPFTCNICEFRCAYKSNLNAHIRTHTVEKPFRCNICEYRCSKKSLLNKHVKTHR